VGARASRWVLEPVLLAWPFLVLVVTFVFAVLWVIDPAGVLPAVLLLLLAAVFFVGARWTRGKVY